MHKSSSWLLKWVDRHDPNDPQWYCTGWIMRRKKEKENKEKGSLLRKRGTPGSSPRR